MSRRAATLLVALLLAAAPAAAQDVTDVPGGDGTLSGRVVESNGKPAADVALSLIAFQGSGEQGLRRSRSAADGSFRFENVAPDPDIVYFVVAQRDGVHHSQRASFEVDAKQLDVDVRIAPTSSATRGARRGESIVRLERSCSGVRVTETHSLSNRTNAVIFVPPPERAGRKPILDLELPENAGEIASPFGATPDGLLREGRRLRFWGPLYPGDQDVEFSYTLGVDGAAGRARWGHPAGAPRLTLLADAGLSELRVEGLAEGSPRDVDGRKHRSFEAKRLAPGAQVEAAFTLSALPPLVKLQEAQLWIEPDDAVLVVDESIAFEPQPEPADGALLCLALPPEASDLRFSQATVALPIATDASGMLELRGPLPPGAQQLTLRYELPVSGEPALFKRRFGVALPLLSVLVSDTGVVPETERLHRRRPVRRDERNYLYLEAFQIAADEQVAIRFRRLPAPRQLPRVATSSFAVALAAALLVFLSGPLRRRDVETDAGETPAQRLAAEREALYGAIHDLDEDFDTGKLTSEDHSRLRAELRAQAVQVLEAERRAAAGSPAPARAAADAGPQAAEGGAQRGEAERSRADPATATNLARPYAGPRPEPAAATGWRFCPDCGGELPQRARFCPHCGSPLRGSEPAA